MPAATATATHLVDATALEAYEVVGPTVEFLTSPDAGDDALTVLRGTIPAGGVVPLHSHADPETFVIVDGTAEALARTAQGARWIAAGPGDIVEVPPNAPHAWRNTSDRPNTAIVLTNGRLARFFREIGTPAGQAPPPREEAVARLLRAAERYGHWTATPEENAAVGIDLAALGALRQDS